MKMNYAIKNILPAVFALCALAGCAQVVEDDPDVREQLVFDAWVLKYVNNDDPNSVAVLQPNGMYAEVLADGDQTLDAGRDTIVWLRLAFTDTDLADNVFATRDSVVALRQGSFTPHTYYVPEYSLYNKASNRGMTHGRFYALQNEIEKIDGSKVKMSKGSKVRLYMPSKLAYTSSGYTNSQGYGGQYGLSGSRPVIEELEVVDVIKNPLAREESLVTDLAQSKWGCVFPRDTMAAFFYVDTLNFTPRADLLAKFPNKPFVDDYKLTVDSTATIWFTGKFLPSAEYPEGFIFDTNIEDVYNDFYDRKIGLDNKYKANAKSDFSALSYKPKSDKSSYITALYKAIPNLRRGQWSRIVFTSAYGYGATGMSAALKEAQASYYSYYNNYYGNNSYYSNGYGSSYYDNYSSNYYYNNYSSYYGYSTSDSTDTSITTEIQSYTPLIFEMYIETVEEE